MDKFFSWLKGFTSREFLLALAAVLSAIVSANVLPDDSILLKAIMAGLAILGALGYGAIRTQQKIAGK